MYLVKKQIKQVTEREATRKAGKQEKDATAPVDKKKDLGKEK